MTALAVHTNAGRTFAEDAIAARFADPEHPRAVFADSDHTFEIVAEALGTSAINRVSTHTWEKLALAGDTEVAIAYSHHPAPCVRLAHNTDIATAATLDTDATRVVDRDHCGVIGAVAEGIHGLSVLALRGDSDIVPALAEDAMETLAGSYDPSRGFAIAMHAMSSVTDAPNSEAATTCAFTFDAGHFTVRRCC